MRWPKDQRFITEAELAEGVARCSRSFAEKCREMRIDADLGPYLNALYLPFAAWLAHRRAAQRDALVVGLCGGQGSGKSTVATLLSLVLREAFGCFTAGLSIDDIYKTKEDRRRLAATVHPLFATRGVPMTHDVELGIETIERLRSQTAEADTSIPIFDKAVDTRLPEAEWPVFHGRADIVIFDGWCVGARPQAETDLVAPINALERDEDPDGVWRRRVNEALAGSYQALFGLSDILVLLAVPSMEQVFMWRRLQEEKLRSARAQSQAAGRSLAIMSEQEVDRFVMHYERLTRHILGEMPHRADLVLALDETHNAAEVIINHPLK